MQITRVPFSKLNYLSKFDKAYAKLDSGLAEFLSYQPAIESFEPAIENRLQHTFYRRELVEMLRDQHAQIGSKKSILDQIDLLEEENTFTVCTAHQLNIFLGPLYYLYKILTTIKLSREVEHYTGKKIVPVFVMGGEDHDFEEISYANIFSKTLRWESKQKGAVGRMHVDNELKYLCKDLFDILGESEHANQIIEVIRESYLNFDNYGQASQKLLTELFGDFGLVVVNLDHWVAKKIFSSIIEDELKHGSSHKLVTETANKIAAAGHKVQVNPRKINLFLHGEQKRQRIDSQDNSFTLVETDVSITESELINNLNSQPEQFSPNVILRPVMQELLLPNLCFVGGGGELAYWIELKQLFKYHSVHFPVLMRRSSFLLVDDRTAAKAKKLGIEMSDVMRDQDELIRSYIASVATSSLSLSNEKRDMSKIFDAIKFKAESIDPTLGNSMAAELVKWEKAFDQMESRLVRTEKKKNEEAIEQIKAIQNKLFPNNGLQERHDNFLPYYLKYGRNFFDNLLNSVDPFNRDFVIVEGI